MWPNPQKIVYLVATKKFLNEKLNFLPWNFSYFYIAWVQFSGISKMCFKENYLLSYLL